MAAHRFSLKKKIFLVSAGILLVIITVSGVWAQNFEQNNLQKTQSLGLTYSPRYAKQLDLDPKATFNQILTDLNPESVRLVAYWDEIEPQPNKYDFSDLDSYVDQAAHKNIPITMVTGFKVPRYPECYAPDWIDVKNTPQRQENTLKMVASVINHYEANPAITSFQIENEPLLEFGRCPAPDLNFLQKEVAMAKSLTTKPILLTDSGELGGWKTIMQMANIFGITVYRNVSTPLFESYNYPFQPAFYSIKANLVPKLFGFNPPPTIIAELQTEVWFNKPIAQTPIEAQIKRFSVQDLQQNFQFAQKTGFSETWAWGVEWWYYLKANGHPEYVEAAKGIYRN